MNKAFDLEKLRGGLIVSCQAYPGEVLFGFGIMARFALAAKIGGAVAIRANSPEDIADIRSLVDLPLIGIWKKHYSDSDVYITPTYRDVAAVVEAGPDIIAMDATLRSRPNGERLEEIVKTFRKEHTVLLMADVSTLEEGLYAQDIGFDIVSTTLSGYTSYSKQSMEPDIELVGQLAKRLSIPVFAEGRIDSPDEARACIEQGAFAVVVGTAITRPHVMTKKFVDRIKG